MRPPKEVIAALKDKGYKLGDWTKAGRGDDVKWLNYCTRGKTCHLVTVAHVTGQYIVEVLSSHEVFHVDEARLQITKKPGI